MRSKRNSSSRTLINSSVVHPKRIKQLQRALSSAHIDICLVDNPTDLFYFTGLKLSAGRLFVHRNHARLFVDGRYIQIAMEKSFVEVSLDQESLLAAFLHKCKGKKMSFNSALTSYDQFLRLQSLLRKLKLHFELVPFSSFYQSLRLIKDKGEISSLRESARLLYRGFEQIRKILKPGITEKQVARSFEIFCLQEGGEGMAFEPIIAFGPNSAMPHYRAGQAKLRKKDIVLVDIGVVLHHYHSDMTRVLFFDSIDPFLATVYAVVHAAQKAALKICRPGVTVGQLDEAARSVMRRHQMEPYFLHSLGHGIGLETHEFPRLKSNGNDKDLILKPGMVITIEPGLYFSGKGGVRYEDTVVITEKGYENFFPEMKKQQLLIKRTEKSTEP